MYHATFKLALLREHEQVDLDSQLTQTLIAFMHQEYNSTITIISIGTLYLYILLQRNDCGWSVGLDLMVRVQKEN